jgi:hypothetical protein
MISGLTDIVVDQLCVNARDDKTSSNLFNSDFDVEGINPLPGIN